jgi:hypothetical protein
MNRRLEIRCVIVTVTCLLTGGSHAQNLTWRNTGQTGESHLEFFSRPWTDFAILNEMDSTGSRMIRGAGGGFGSLYRMLGWFG